MYFGMGKEISRKLEINMHWLRDAKVRTSAKESIMQAMQSSKMPDETKVCQGTS